MNRLFALLTLTACAACSTAPERSSITTNSGMPLSDGLQRYDVLHYELRNDIQVERKAIAGSSAMTFVAKVAMQELELDFDGLFTIVAVYDAAGPLEYRQEPAKLFVSLRETLPVGATHAVTVEYHGRPHEAERPPWGGGFVWATTPSGKPWVATAIQGEGCDLWFPCKDHPSGEPASMDLYFTVPEGLTAASNGVLQDTVAAPGGRVTFHWRTEVPTNTYGVALNVGPYVLLESEYRSSNGTLIPIRFWAIEDHEEDARELLEREFAPSIEFFERKLGPYPWGQEKLGVAETPHLGMEHQTINAYGNEFRRDAYGFDWLFHHELAHEWFGNVMTHTTVSDMWLHEGTGAFMQPEYTREVLGEAAYYARMYQVYLRIKSCNPMAPREEFSADELYFDDPGGKGPAGDIYSKGIWVLQSLRYLVGEDKFWEAIRRLIYDTAEPEKLAPPIPARLRSTDDFLEIASAVAGRDLAWFFEVYARRAPLPVLELSDAPDGALLRWTNVGELQFPMPVPVRVNGTLQRIEFSGNEARLPGVSVDELQVDPFMRILRKLPVVPTCEERLTEDLSGQRI